MKTLTPDQRIEGFTELVDENENAHLTSFLAGVAHAEKILAESATDDELNLSCKSVQKRLATQWGDVKATPRKFVRLSEEEMDNLFDEIISRTFDDPARIEDFGYAIQSALEEKNK